MIIKLVVLIDNSARERRIFDFPVTQHFLGKLHMLFILILCKPLIKGVQCFSVVAYIVIIVRRLLCETCTITVVAPHSHSRRVSEYPAC